MANVRGMRRPILILLFGALLFLVGILQVLYGLAAVLATTGGAVSTIGVLTLVFGIITLGLGYGSLQGWGWIWTLIMIVVVVNIILSLVNLLAVALGIYAGITGVGGIIISLIILLYMNTRTVRAWFGKIPGMPRRA